MAFSRSLLIKGIAGGLGACTACAGGVGIYKSVSSSVTDKQLIEKAGLECGLDGDELTGTDSKDCTVKADGGKINVKQERQVEEGVSYSSGTQKLKVSKSLEGNYSNGLKFVVDSGDITLTKTGEGQNNLTINKLGQYETYEITESGGKYYLTRKTEAKEEKEKALGLFGKCEFPASGNSDCTFNTEEIKKVKFEGAGDEGVTVTGESVSLKITKVTGTDPFTDSLRFTFTFPSDVTISTDNSVKANTPTDFKIKKGNGNDLSLEKAWSNVNDLVGKIGLECTGSNGEECSTKSSSSGEKLNVKVGDKKNEGVDSFNGGKIKLDKDQAGYNQGFKFTIINSPITLTGGSGDTNITKLEQFETYEITEENNKYYLTRKTGPEGDIKTALGLPCDLPSSDSVSCDLDSQKFQKIKFDGKNTVSSETVTLTISKTNDNNFPLGYRFTFSTTSEATISNTNKIKANAPTDFKIKKTADSNDISLEKAWSDVNDLVGKIGLTCTTESSGECCSKAGTEKLNVKRGNDKKEDITSFNGGKIKLEKEQAGYNQGFKFTITGGDVTLTDGNVASGSADFTTLGELETYEIVEEGGKYYLSRKTNGETALKSSLSIPEKCFKTLNTECTLTTQELQSINFNDKESPSATGAVTLTISKGNSTSDFPLGYKFTLKSSQDITIKSDTNIVKANTNTEFKIKRETGGGISLEKAWTSTTLGTKVGIQSCNDDTKECTLSDSGTLKVMQDDKKETSLTKNSSDTNGGKIKVYKDQEGYNQGFKFFIEDGRIDLNGSNAQNDSDKIKSLDEYETYEIKEEGSSWYLARKDKAEVYIKKQLNIEEFCTGSFPTSTSPSTCNNIKEVSKLQNIKFDNKTGHGWPTGNIEIQLEINKDTSFPGGFKFTFNECSSPNCSLPGSTNAKKDSSCGLIYQIKRDTTNSGTICLEPKPKSDGGSTGGQCT